jgi:hypothetical protein
MVILTHRRARMNIEDLTVHDAVDAGTIGTPVLLGILNGIAGSRSMLWCGATRTALYWNIPR